MLMNLTIIYRTIEKYNPIIIVPTFFTLLLSQQSVFCLFSRNFAPRPDEETGPAEGQPVSNMAVPMLKAGKEGDIPPMDGSLHSEGHLR